MLKNKLTIVEMNEQFINNVQAFRKMRGMSAKELSERAGLGTNFVAQLERGTSKNPNIENVFKLAQALDIEPEYLLALGNR